MNERTKEIYYNCSMVHFEVYSHEFEVRVVFLVGIIDPLPRFSWILLFPCIPWFGGFCHE